MKVVTSIAKMQELSRQTRGAGLRLAFVPTMGFLHDGHVALVRQARELAEVVVVSIFVNPTQFNRSDDFESYPRDEQADRAVLEHENVDILFLPSVGDVYPRGASTCVRVGDLDRHLCGPGRPGHFEGVTTVVAALFNMVLPDVAIFGEKDYQQLQIVRRMARDLHFPVEIVGGPTVRESDGLAMSSRNARLSTADRANAPVIHRALSAAADRFLEGETDAAALVETARSAMQDCEGLAVEYVELVDGDTLARAESAHTGCVLAAAASFGPVRLIDNFPLRRAADRRARAQREDASPTTHPPGAEPNA